MKTFTHLLLLASLFLLGACASTRSTAPADDSGSAERESTGSGEGLLMDRYTSGDIPGFRD
jgi:hypothetical protein